MPCHQDPARQFASTADLHQQLRDLHDHFSELSSFSPAIPARPLLKALGADAGGARRVRQAWRWPSLSPRRTPPAEAYRLRRSHRGNRGVSARMVARRPDPGLCQADQQNRSDSDSRTEFFFAGPNHARAKRLPVPIPGWSPDGLYYSSQGILWSVRRRWRASQVAIPNVAKNLGGPAAISPDGKTFAFMRDDGMTVSLYLQPVAGGNAVAMKAPFPANFASLTECISSPDGRKLLIGLVQAIDVKGWQLWIVLSRMARRGWCHRNSDHDRCGRIHLGQRQPARCLFLGVDPRHRQSLLSDGHRNGRISADQRRRGRRERARRSHPTPQDRLRQCASTTPISWK